MNKLDSLGFISEIEDDEHRYQQLAVDYANSIEDKQSTLVIAPSHAERERVVTAIRDELKLRGIVGVNEHRLATLQSKQLTQAQRADLVNYENGDVVEFITKGKGGFLPGDRLEVAGIEKGEVFALSGDQRVRIPLESPKSFTVYRKVDRLFAPGDQVRITKNRKAVGNESRLNNGSVFKIEGFTKEGDLQLSNGNSLPASWQHIDHGIALTSYSAQGKTYDRALVAQSHLSYTASSPEQLYVTASRARDKTMIYTDDKSSFLSAVSRKRSDMNASDLVRPKVRAQASRKQRSIAQQVRHIRLHVSGFARTQAAKILEWVGVKQHRQEMTV